MVAGSVRHFKYTAEEFQYSDVVMLECRVFRRGFESSLPSQRYQLEVNTELTKSSLPAKLISKTNPAGLYRPLFVDLTHPLFDQRHACTGLITYRCNDQGQKGQISNNLKTQFPSFTSNRTGKILMQH